MSTDANPDYTIRARIVCDDATGPGARGAKTAIKQVTDEAVSASGWITRAFALIGGAAGVGFAVRGLIGLNAEIQSAVVGMASLLNASTGTPMDRSMRIARSTLAGLREDAAKGAGELTDYAVGFQLLLNPGMSAGKSLQDIRELTRTAVGAGFALRGLEGIRLAPMDVQQALTGQLGERTTPIVFQALRAAKVDIEKFRASSQAEKFDTLMTAFGKFAPGIEQMGKTWDAQFSTLKDNIKEVIRGVTGPLFDRWTKDLIRANEWLAKNRGEVVEIVTSWGHRMVSLWDTLIDRAGTYAAILAASQVVPMVPGLTGRVGGAARGFGAGVAADYARGAAGIALPGGGAMLGGRFFGVTAATSGALTTIGTAAARVAWPLALVTTAFLAIKGAIGEFPMVAAFVAKSSADLMSALGDLGGAFESLTADGSALNVVGAALIGIVGGLIQVLAVGVRILATVVEGIGFVLEVLGVAIRNIFRIIMGDEAGLASTSGFVAKRFGARGDAIAKIWGGGKESAPMSKYGVRRRTGEGDALDAMPVAQNVTNINGPVTMQVKTEVNADPARVLAALGEGVDKLRTFATQGRRLPVLGV